MKLKYYSTLILWRNLSFLAIFIGRNHDLDEENFYIIAQKASPNYFFNDAK